MSMNELREMVIGYIVLVKSSRDNTFMLNQHDFANTIGANSGHISQILSRMQREGKIRRLRRGLAGAPALYEVIA